MYLCTSRKSNYWPKLKHEKGSTEKKILQQNSFSFNRFKKEQAALLVICIDFIHVGFRVNCLKKRSRFAFKCHNDC